VRRRSETIVLNAQNREQFLRVWTIFIWLRTRISGRLSWIRQCAFEFSKDRRFYLAEWLSASQEGLCSIWRVIIIANLWKWCKTVTSSICLLILRCWAPVSWSPTVT
jgi:hypothetical protein